VTARVLEGLVPLHMRAGPPPYRSPGNHLVPTSMVLQPNTPVTSDGVGKTESVQNRVLTIH
jgi:hypothetical protein